MCFGVNRHLIPELCERKLRFRVVGELLQLRFLCFRTGQLLPVLKIHEKIDVHTTKNHSCVNVCVRKCLSNKMYPGVYIYIYISLSLSIYLSIYLSIHPSIYPYLFIDHLFFIPSFICLFICLFIYLFMLAGGKPRV